MKITRNVKNTLALILVVFMLVACIPMSAFATDVNNTFESVEINQEEVQPRQSYVGFTYPDTTEITVESTMNKMSYTVANNAGKHILFRLTNKSNPAQYYTYSLIGITGEYNANVSPGTYTLSVVGGNNTNFSNIRIMFFRQ